LGKKNLPDKNIGNQLNKSSSGSLNNFDGYYDSVSFGPLTLKIYNKHKRLDSGEFQRLPDLCAKVKFNDFSRYLSSSDLKRLLDFLLRNRKAISRIARQELEYFTHYMDSLGGDLSED